MMEATLGPAVVAKVEVMTGVRAVARMEATSGAVVVEALIGTVVVARVVPQMEAMPGPVVVSLMEAMLGPVVVVVVAMMVVLGVAAKGTMQAVVVARLLPEVGRSIVIIVTLFLSLLNHRQHRTLQLIQLRLSGSWVMPVQRGLSCSMSVCVR